MQNSELKASQKPSSGTPAGMRRIISGLGFCCIAVLCWWALTPVKISTNGFSTRTVNPCVMDQNGYLRGKLFGQIQAELDWHGDNMRCDGMYRPEGQGIRLVFDEHLDEDLPGLLIVIGIADAVPGSEVKDAPANITIIDQSRGLFFSTQEEPRCWTTLTSQLLLTGTTEETWRMNGQLYCASALAALTGNGTVTLDDIEFSGVFKPAIN
jgi:hypothetical protein